MTCYVTDRHEYLSSRDEIGAAWREIMGAELSGDGAGRGEGPGRGAAKVEIETTAVVEE